MLSSSATAFGPLPPSSCRVLHQPDCLTSSTPSSCCVLPHLIALRNVLLPPLLVVSLATQSPHIVSSAAPSPPIVHHPLTLSCPFLPLLSCFLPHACLASSTCPSCCIIHCPLTPYILYLNLIVAFILLSLPPLHHRLLQRQWLLNTTSTTKHPQPSLPLNIVFICHRRRLPCCPSPPSNTARCRSCQTPSSLPLAPFTVLSSSVTAAAFTVVHCRHQTRPPAIATRCRSCQSPSLLPPPFTLFHCHVHQTPSNPIAPFEHLRSPQMVVAAVGG